MLFNTFGVFVISKLNTRYIALLALVTSVLITAYYSGLLRTEFDVALHSISRADVGKYTQLLDNYSKEDKTGSISILCDAVIPETGKAKPCGVAYILSSNRAKGYDFSKYQSLDLTLRYVTPEPSNELSLYIKNFNPRYSSLTDPVSLKYNAVRFTPSSKFSDISIPLNSMYVATWWIERRKITYADSGVDVSNVPVIHFSTGNLKTAGTYHLEIQSAIFRGELISKTTLFIIVIGMWFCTIIFLLNRNRRVITEVSRQDTLTTVLNRRGLEFWLSKNYESLKNDIVVYYIDIDNFKKVNDTHGHIRGDELIKSVCNNIRKSLQDISSQHQNKVSHCFARVSGDEFLVIFKGLEKTSSEEAAYDLLAHISQPIKAGSKNIKVNASIGIAIKNSYSTLSEDLIRHADTAMYIAKKLGKNQCQMYNEDIQQEIDEKKRVASAVQNALENKLFYLEYMPIYSGSTLKITGAEALIRCTGGLLSSLSPEVYIPIAEEFSLIREIDSWVVEQVFRDVASVKPEHRISYSINISSIQLHSTGFLSKVAYLLKVYDINPKDILFELTETNLVAMDQQSVAFLNELRAMGFRIALDDFGTGYTAFAQLIEYPIQYLKIDKSFIELIGYKDKSVMVDSILAIAKSYNLKVVAEGVQSEEQLAYLQSLSCDYLQGFYFSRSISWKKLLSKISQPKLKQVN